MTTFVIDKKIKILLVLLGVTLGISLMSWSEIAIFADSDDDGVNDYLDNCPSNANRDQADFDFDKIGDECDTDDDNDGVTDSLDQFDTDPTDWADSDSDSIGDNKDTDDDNDGVTDSLDQFDTDPFEWADFDFDGVGSSKDTDDDNDGILDSDDTSPLPTSEHLAIKYLKDIETCAEMNDGTLRLVCYSEFFGTITKNENSNSDALELSIALSKIGTIDDCHFVSHEIGHASYEETKDVTKSLHGMDGTMCRGGYFHGVLSSYFHNIEELGKSFPDSYQTICNDLIGSSNYQDCVHGLGHGFVHYFGDDLDSSLESCHDLSFYQNILCVKGVMMQYTDNVLTRDGISENVISNICDENQLRGNDYVECNMSTGTTLAFFANHDFEKGKELCTLIEDEDARNYCVEGLRLEIQDSERYESSPLTEDVREKFQPQFIEGISKTIDIRSPALVSDFQFVPEIELISFTVDRPQYVILYIPNDLVGSKMAVMVNGQSPSQLDAKNNVLGEDIVMIKFVPNEQGLVLITPLAQ
ncbi:thrombospondin type 3 repeat-containing protein [Nitrosopumilus sp. K4]|uniref:thrombospondin type 3 repeat-containing protein n=1 Tax=Nitrosopumilus sp. K4 TaxID=2795383 RepID=UPI001BACF818|nr:thrombospondin type 3 repeat-containing protein [Nitrosopumilus sp. K4]QUC64025.1 thrombospondin type 3 repeat-containing protein [Nitrosopumilus sp. K4]